jgi:hypothetical protein
VLAVGHATIILRVVRGFGDDSKGVSRRYILGHGGLSIALVTLLAVGTGVVVIVVAIAVVLLVLLVTLSMRGRQKRGGQRRDDTRRALEGAVDRAGRAERHASAQEQDRRSDPDS